MHKAVENAVPCRVGLWQLKNLLTDVMNGTATLESLDLMEDLAVSIMDSADCAIGYEAARMVYQEPDRMPGRLRGACPSGKMYLSI